MRRRTTTRAARATLCAAAALAATTALAGCAARRPAAREVISPPRASRLPVFSPAVRAGGLIFLSGQIGTRPGTLELVPGGIEAETRQTLENVRAVLRSAGADLEDVVKCTVFLADIRDYDAMNRVYATFFPKDPPARSTVAGSGLALGARVEIECIAAAR